VTYQIEPTAIPPAGAVVVAPPVPTTDAAGSVPAVVEQANTADDFGPAGYDPTSVDNFVARVADQLDALRIDNLRAQTELDALRTRMCESAESAALFTPDQRIEEHFTSAAHVIRTAIDTAERRAAQLVHDAEQTAANLRTNAQRDAACSLQAAAAMADARRSEAQAACDRMMRAAHEQATQLQTETAMRQLDHTPAPSAEITIDENGEVAYDGPKRERTFEALWHAGTGSEDPSMDRYFQRSADDKASF